MLRFAEVAVGDGEGTACVRCAEAAASSLAPAAAVVSAIGAACEAWPGPGAPNVSLGGPEPFSHPELPALVASAVAAGAARIRLVSDARALAAGENAAGCQVAGVRHLRVVCLGDASVHDVLAGGPGRHEAAVAGMRAWRAAAQAAGHRTHLSVLVPVCPHNVRDLHLTVGAVAPEGVREVVLRLAPALDVAEAGPFIAAACDTGTVNRVWVSVEGVSPDALAERRLHALALGAIT